MQQPSPVPGPGGSAPARRGASPLTWIIAVGGSLILAFALIWGALSLTGGQAAAPAAPATSEPAPTPTESAPASAAPAAPSPTPTRTKITLDPTPSVAPPLVRVHHPAKAKLANSVVRLGPVEARTFLDAEVDREAPTRTLQLKDGLAVQYLFDPIGPPTAAEQCALYLQRMGEGWAEAVTTAPEALGDGAVDAAACAIAGPLDGEDTTMEWTTFRTPEGTHYAVGAQYATAIAVEPRVTASLDYGRCIFAFGLGAEIGCEWDELGKPTKDPLDGLRRVPSSARDMTLTEADLIVGAVSFKLPEGFSVEESTITDHGLSYARISNPAIEITVEMFHTMPSTKLSPTTEYCDTMLDALIEGATPVDRLPAFMAEDSPQMYEELKESMGDLLGDFSVPAQVAMCAAHVESTKSAGVVIDAAVTVWEAKSGERMVLRTFEPLERFKADPEAYSHKYLRCSTSTYFGSAFGCG